MSILKSPVSALRRHFAMGALKNDAKVEIEWVDSEELTKDNIQHKLFRLQRSGLPVPWKMTE
jgi:CTP synthase (UTP-ammonia lyase)